MNQDSAAAFELERLSAHSRYKLLTSLIAPRPIAFVTTVNESGLVNAAPFSLFNMLGEDPPLVVVSVNKKEGGSFKDTAKNILQSREFVVNMCDEPLAAAMHASAEEFPPNVSEVTALGLETQPSIAVRPPRLSAAPAAFECVLDEHLENTSRFIFLGRVLWLHARPGLVDVDTHRIDLVNYMPVGRLGGGEYVKTKDRFTIKSNP